MTWFGSAIELTIGNQIFCWLDWTEQIFNATTKQELKLFRFHDLTALKPLICSINCQCPNPYIFSIYITDIGECVTDGVDHCAGGGMCKWKDGKYQCVCATNGIDYCTGEDAECRNIGGRWTCICVDGYQGYHGDCRGLVLNNVYSMTYRFFY